MLHVKSRQEEGVPRKSVLYLEPCVYFVSTGVRYVIDTSYGNCTTVALSASLQDTQRNITAGNVNGSYVISMKNPLRLLYLDHNYTYIGKVSWNTLFGQTQFSKVCPFNIMSLKVREIIHLIAVSTFLVMRVLILHLINTVYLISIIRLFTWVHCEPLWNETKTSTVCVVFYCLTRKAVH